MGFWSRLKARLFGRNQIDRRSQAEGTLRAAHALRTGSAEAPPVTPNEGGEPVRETFGVTPDDPVLCNQPAGERAYIASLRCPNGHRLGGPRRGSGAGKCTDPNHHLALFLTPGANPADGCIVDRYELRCEGGEFSCTLYFDMYHPSPPAQPAPRGMTRV
jgi:hypothetical protein